MWIAIITSALASSALFTFIQFLITRHDNQKDCAREIKERVESLQTAFDKLHVEIDERDALEARRRIIAASDELRHGKRHSKEWFDQLNEDVTNYNRYCKDHEDFANNRAVNAIEHINKVYLKLLETNDFDD